MIPIIFPLQFAIMSLKTALIRFYLKSPTLTKTYLLLKNIFFAGPFFRFANPIYKGLEFC